MTLEELYAQVDGNYQEVLGRLRMDKLVDRFIVKFLDDTSCQKLIDAYAAKDDKGCFDAAHGAKGLCANLALNKLSKLASDICECFREGNEDLRKATDVDRLMEEFTACYLKSRQVIEAYAAER